MSDEYSIDRSTMWLAIRALRSYAMIGYVDTVIGKKGILTATYLLDINMAFSVQLLLCEKIGEAISPTYKEARGN